MLLSVTVCNRIHNYILYCALKNNFLLHTVTLRAFFFTEYTQTLIYQVQLNYLVYYCMDNL